MSTIFPSEPLLGKKQAVPWRKVGWSLGGLALLALIVAFVLPGGSAASQLPTFAIVSVVADSSVTIQTANFPANQNFQVTMGAYGTQGIGGTVVATSNSGAGGSLSATYNIPANLHGADRIAIRLQSPQGYYAYNWFYNSNAGAGVTPVPVTPGPIYSGIPTFSIESVVADTSVTIKGNNFPPNQTFQVTMGAFGTQGIGGTAAGSMASGSGGSFTATYNIPANLKGSARIAIRLQSPQGYYAYNWFHNSTAGGPTATAPAVTVTPGTPPPPTATPGPVYTGFPSFTITSVQKDTAVTIQGTNFPPNQTFQVTMGAFGTLGIGGVAAGSQSTGAGGAFTATYNIPAGLAGSYRIAIRLQSSQGYYAYNWFYNSTAP